MFRSEGSDPDNQRRRPAKTPGAYPTFPFLLVDDELEVRLARITRMYACLNPTLQQAVEIARAVQSFDLFEAAYQASAQEDERHHLPACGLYQACA